MATAHNAGQAGIWIKTNDPGRFDRLVLEYARNLLRLSMRTVPRVTNKAIAAREEMPRHRVGRLIAALEIEEDMRLEKERRASDVKDRATADKTFAALDVHIKCPRCGELRALNKSADIRYTVDCAPCGVRFFYQLVSLAMLDEVALEAPPAEEPEKEVTGE